MKAKNISCNAKWFSC